jgi:tetratricopeptide (TPR) repeat protein
MPSPALPPPPAESVPAPSTTTTTEDLNFNNASKYGDYVERVLTDYEAGKISKEEALRKLDAADRYLTRPELTARLYPPGGLRERANRILGFVYDVDRKEPEGDTPTNFKSVRQYSDRLDAITDSYQSGKISKTEALAMIAAANDHATTGLALRLFPPQGMREKMAQIFAYLYDIDKENEKIKGMLANAAIWPERVSAELLYSWGETALNEKRDLAAYEWFSMTLRNNPNFAEAYRKRGNARLSFKDYEGAIKDYTEAIALKPDLPEAFYNRGTVRYQLKDLAGAIEDFTKAIALKPNYGRAYYNRGVALLQIGQKEKGNQDLKRGKELLRTEVSAPPSP